MGSHDHERNKTGLRLATALSVAAWRAGVRLPAVTLPPCLSLTYLLIFKPRNQNQAAVKSLASSTLCFNQFHILATFQLNTTCKMILPSKQGRWCRGRDCIGDLHSSDTKGQVVKGFLFFRVSRNVASDNDPPAFASSCSYEDVQHDRRPEEGAAELEAAKHR